MRTHHAVAFACKIITSILLPEEKSTPPSPAPLGVWIGEDFSAPFIAMNASKFSPDTAFVQRFALSYLSTNCLLLHPGDRVVVTVLDEFALCCCWQVWRRAFAVVDTSLAAVVPRIHDLGQPPAGSALMRSSRTPSRSSGRSKRNTSRLTPPLALWWVLVPLSQVEKLLSSPGSESNNAC